MAAPANIEHSFGRFEPGALTPFSPRPTASRHADSGPAANVVANPIEVLLARFPVIRRLVGDESFRAMARRFIDSEPLHSPTLLHYGETFPRFLRGLRDIASIEYVADIAELEMVQGSAYHAADALPVDVQAFSSLRAGKHNGVRVVLHPSVFLVASRFPIVTIWNNNQSDGENALIDRWRPESALVARPFLDVEVRCLPPGGHAFIGRLADGHTMATAIAAGKAVTPDFDIASNLAVLSEANIVVGLREDA